MRMLLVRRAMRLDVEAKVDDVAFLHDVFSTLRTKKAGFADGLQSLQPDEVVVRRDLRADEAALDVAMNGPGGLRRFGPARDRPRANFFSPAVRKVIRSSRR